MDEETTPAGLARELGVPAKRIRAVLRTAYGKLPPGVTRWKLTPEQVSHIRSRFT
ncbi:hypothetical protein [Pseudactinotalea sp. HY158]|uniref:hypothetical protein n=1 Tax=Pseudactinotalea sp. HY158 TaxID=2654547 RepID=UPI00129C3ACB|nr:hypothetical protein [Pseudactinotalea sp. HY158]QGH70581.1 hypothetical protein GCE65_14595 [Pseudactinotalea sp. HY158]